MLMQWVPVRKWEPRQGQKLAREPHLLPWMNRQQWWLDLITGLPVAGADVLLLQVL